MSAREGEPERETAGSSQMLIRGHGRYKVQKTHRLTKKEKLRSN